MGFFEYTQVYRILPIMPQMLIGSLSRLSINPFPATGLFLYPLKTSQNLCFFNIFRGYRKRPVEWNELMTVNLFSDNPTKWSDTLKQFVGSFPTNCSCVFEHFVGLALKGLNLKSNERQDHSKRSISYSFSYRNTILYDIPIRHITSLSFIT